MLHVRSPIDPPVSKPFLTIFLFLILLLIFGIFLVNGIEFSQLPMLIIGIFLMSILVVSYRIFIGFVYPKRKNRRPSNEYTRVDWHSSDNHLIVRYEKWNDSLAPLIIAIHGWQSDSSSSEYKIKPFIDAGYHSVMIDLPGHGFSDGMKIWTAVESGQRILSMIENQSANWDKSKIQSIVLFGHSIGGFVVLRHADRMSEILPMPLSRVYLESPMTSFPLVYKQRTKGWKFIPGILALIDLRWAFNRDGPGSEIIWKDFEVPGWGVPSISTRILQAKDDVALGEHHLNLLRPYARDDWEIIIDPNLKHFGREEKRGNASIHYESWLKN